jgi:hypothetical protein
MIDRIAPASLLSARLGAMSVVADHVVHARGPRSGRCVGRDLERRFGGT